MLNSEILPLSLSFYFAAGGLGLLMLPWLIRLPRLAIAALLFSLVLGQTVRLTLPSQGGGILFSDVAVVAVLLSAVVRLMWLPGRRPFVISCLFTPFILWSLYALIINAPQLGLSNAVISLSYWLRLTAQLLLLPALLFLLRDKQTKKTAYHGLLISLIALLLLGLAQLLFLPSLTGLTPFGWDPHQHRLVSTWLDPNFFGAFLAVTLPLALLTAIKFNCAGKQTRHRQDSRPVSGSARWEPHGAAIIKTLTIFIPLLSFIALFFTQSRSSLLALALTSLIASPFIVVSLIRKTTSPHLMIIILGAAAIVLLLGFTGTFFLKSRLYGLLALDATVQLRLSSIQQAWTLVERRPWIGVGYNAYQFAALDAGLISNFNIHSRAGTDNSFLTLWATTGLPGLILFFIPFALIAHILIRRWLLFNSSLALIALISSATLLFHAQLVNSLLYSHLLITLIIIIALALASPSTKKVDLTASPRQKKQSPRIKHRLCERSEAISGNSSS